MDALWILAQAATSATQGTQRAPGWIDQPWIPILLVVVIMYVFIFRSKRTTEKKRQNMLGQLKRGDRVQTIGGILGTVVDARDHEVVLKVDETSNTKIRFARSAIHRVVEEEKGESK